MNPKFDYKVFLERKKIRDQMVKLFGLALIPRPYETYCSLKKTKTGFKTTKMELVKNPYYLFERAEFLREFPQQKNKLDIMENEKWILKN